MRTQYVIKVLWMASLSTRRGGLYSPFVPCDDRAPHRVQNAPRSTCRRPSAASPGPLEGPAEAPALRAGSEGARLPRRCIRGWGEGLHLVLSAGAATRRVHKVNSRVSITSFHHGLWKVRNLQPGTCLFPKTFYFLPFWTAVDPRRWQLQVRGGEETWVTQSGGGQPRGSWEKVSAQPSWGGTRTSWGAVSALGHRWGR